MDLDAVLAPFEGGMNASKNSDENRKRLYLMIGDVEASASSTSLTVLLIKRR